MTGPSKTTLASQLEKANNRHEHHESDAADLKRAQELEALRLHDTQMQGSGTDLRRSQKSAAAALEHSQKDHADALRAVHEDHEARLKRFQEAERENLDDKDRLIAWLTGSYSVADNNKEGG